MSLVLLQTPLRRVLQTSRINQEIAGTHHENEVARSGRGALSSNFRIRHHATKPNRERMNGAQLLFEIRPRSRARASVVCKVLQFIRMRTLRPNQRWAIGSLFSNPFAGSNVTP